MTQLNVNWLEAKAEADRVRSAKAEDKKRIKRGHLDPAKILFDPPKHWRNAKLLELLLAMPKVGRVKAGKWMRMHHLTATRRICDVPTQQRIRLANHLDVWSGSRDRVRRMMEGRDS